MTHRVYHCDADHGVGGVTAYPRDLAIAGTAFACLVAAFVIPPSAAESGPVICPFRLATGLPCPGCGLARSWVALVHGDLDTALARHAFGPLLFALAIVAVMAVVYSFVRQCGPINLAARAGSTPAIALAVVWCGWWLVRLPV